jgi:ankyrin repeat protein
MQEILNAIQGKDFENFKILLTQYDIDNKNTEYGTLVEIYNTYLDEIAKAGDIRFAQFICTKIKRCPGDMDQALISASANGNLDMVDFLLHGPQLKKRAKIEIAKTDGAFIMACKNYHPHVIKYFIEHEKNDIDWSGAFLIACGSGNLESVRYLLTSNDLEKKADIHFMSDTALSKATAGGFLEIVEYLTASPELTDHISKPLSFNSALTQAVNNSSINPLTQVNERLQIFEYLLSSPKLTTHADVHSDKDMLIKFLCRRNNTEFLEFIICNMNMEKTDYVKQYLSEPTVDLNEKSCIDYAEKLFKLRDLNNKLNINLNDSSTLEKKKKTGKNKL